MRRSRLHCARRNVQYHFGQIRRLAHDRHCAARARRDRVFGRDRERRRRGGVWERRDGSNTRRERSDLNRIAERLTEIVYRGRVVADLIAAFVDGVEQPRRGLQVGELPVVVTDAIVGSAGARHRARPERAQVGILRLRAVERSHPIDLRLRHSAASAQRQHCRSTQSASNASNQGR